MRPALDLQLKATVNLMRRGDRYVRYQLNVHNYKLLRVETQTPRLLVVLDLPKEESCWMTVTAHELVLRHRAYWLSLRGCDETQNSKTINVSIPKQNLFNVESLKVLMEKSREGSIQ